MGADVPVPHQFRANKRLWNFPAEQSQIAKGEFGIGLIQTDIQIIVEIGQGDVRAVRIIRIARCQLPTNGQSFVHRIGGSKTGAQHATVAVAGILITKIRLITQAEVAIDGQL